MSKVNEPTGKYRYRTNWRGNLILQVEVNRQHTNSNDLWTTDYTAWRDATISDLQVIDAKPRVYDSRPENQV